MKIFPLLLLKNQIFTRKGLWETEVSGRVVRTAFYVSGVTFWEEQFFWRRKRFFLSSFPTFCWNFSNFRIHFGRLEKHFRICWWNWTPLLRTKVLLGKNVCRSFHVHESISSCSEKFWDLVKKKFSVWLSILHLFFKRTVWHINRFVKFLVRTKKNKRSVSGYWLKTTRNVCQTTTDIVSRRFFWRRRCGWKVSQKGKLRNTKCSSEKFEQSAEAFFCVIVFWGNSEILSEPKRKQLSAAVRDAFH